MKTTRMRRRGIGGQVFVLVALMCVLASGISGIVAAQSGPVFDRVTLSASSVARGGTVTISAHITDGTADVLDAPTVFFLLPDGADGPAFDFTLVSGDARDGRYDATATISPLLPPGQYPVKLLRAYDGDGNIGFVMPPDPRLAALTLTVTDGAMGGATGTPSASATASATATVSATARTTTPATSLPSPTVGVTASTSPTVTATAAGTRFPSATATRSPISTVSRPTPTLMASPVPTDGPGPDIPSTSTPVPTIAVRVTVLPTATAAATAVTTATATPRPTVTPITATTATATAAPTATATTRATATTATTAATATPTATANATPTRPMSAATATAQRTATATATTTGAGPVLVSLAVSDATALPGDALIVTARITDSAADVADFPTLRYRLPDGSDGPFAYLRRVDGTARDGSYQAVVGLSPFFPPGIYTIAAVTITDTAGTTTVFSAPTPAQPDATFIVQPFMPPTPTPLPSDAG